MRTEIICIVVASLAWGGYPLIARSTGVGTPIGALILTLSALIPISVATAWNGVASRPTSNEMIKLIVAGMVMGVGTTAFNYLVNSRQLEASISIPIVDVAMLIVSVAAAVIFFSEPLTTKKILGFALLIAGIVVLRPE
jgi:drug/metabolite transporter (DMT)-like permease